MVEEAHAVVGLHEAVLVARVRHALVLHRAPRLRHVLDPEPAGRPVKRVHIYILRDTEKCAADAC